MPANNADSKWNALRSDRRRVLALLHKWGAEVVATDRDGAAPGRELMLGARVRDTGALVGTAGGRELRAEWGWSLDRERARIGGCESTVLLSWSGGPSTAPDTFRPVVLRCGSRMCPVCFAARSGRAMHKWGPVVDAALFGGARVWHVTLTQRVREAWGSAVLPGEARRWSGVVPTSDAVVVPAVAGESAGEAYARWRATWHTLRNSRWSESCAGLGYLLGIEFTLRAKRGGRVQRPRWHCHGHVLVVSTDARWTPERMLRDWARLAGVDSEARLTTGETRFGTAFIRFGAQYSSAVEGRDALLEVLKYPFKPGELTAAAMLDAWTVLRGSRTHVPAGALHGTSRAARAEPWRGWLQAPPDAPGWGMLEWEQPLADDRATWLRLTASNVELAHGQRRRMRVRRSDGAEVMWEGDPREWAAAAAAHPVHESVGPEAEAE